MYRGVNKDIASLNYSTRSLADVLAIIWSLRASLCCVALFYAYKHVGRWQKERVSLL